MATRQRLNVFDIGDKTHIQNISYALMEAAKEMKIDVFYDNGRNKDWHKFPDSIACVPMYNKEGLAEYIDKEFKVKNENNNCSVDVDNLILDNEIFN